MNKKYLNRLDVKFEDEAVMASLEDSMMNTETDYVDLNKSLDKRNTVYKLLTEVSTNINNIPYFEDIIKFSEGDNDIYPCFYGIYEREKGLVIGFDSSKVKYDIDVLEYDEVNQVVKFKLMMFSNTLKFDIACYVDELNEIIVKRIIDQLEDNIEEIIIAKALKLANDAGLKVNVKRSLAQIEKGLEDSLNMIIYQFNRKLKRGKF